ncbi:MAG: SAM-dependent methyltransferase, partial [Verrucomicrobiota bacterium]
MKPMLRLLLLLIAESVRTLAADTPPSTPPPADAPPAYEFRPGSFDGTGKWFLGREIAHFMSHQG